VRKQQGVSLNTILGDNGHLGRKEQIVGGQQKFCTFIVVVNADAVQGDG
jgi:hypothetical protein